MYGALVLFEDEFIHIVSISFTALILTELIMVALTIRTWHRLVAFNSINWTAKLTISLFVFFSHRLMVIAEIFSLLLYVLSLVILHDYFGNLIISVEMNKTNSWTFFFSFDYSNTDWDFIWSFEFLWKVLAITLVSCLPLYIIKFLRKKFSPPAYSKLSWEYDYV